MFFTALFTDQHTGRMFKFESFLWRSAEDSSGNSYDSPNYKSDLGTK